MQPLRLFEVDSPKGHENQEGLLRLEMLLSVRRYYWPYIASVLCCQPLCFGIESLLFLQETDQRSSQSKHRQSIVSYR